MGQEGPQLGQRTRSLCTACTLALALICALTARAMAAPSPPAATYENTLHAFVYQPSSLATQAEFDAAADRLLALAQGGTYARLGFVEYYTVDLPWTANLTTPELSRPSRGELSSLLARLQSRGLTYHVSAMLGMSRAMQVYDAAKRADRRNAQWFHDGLIDVPGASAATQAARAWITPSRYARKLRSHLEAKTRAFARLFLDLRQSFPSTLISASGDAEAELNMDRLDPAVRVRDQMIADYSPFAILEFRDWLLGTGLYAPGATYAADAFRKSRHDTFAQGASALTTANLAAFNASMGTSFASWRLESFDWSLDDPLAGDIQAIPWATWSAGGFDPTPETGAGYIAGGFDAPRSIRDGSTRLWRLWLRFRREMIANYGSDVARWMTTTPGTTGTTLSADRWYSHQIPGDFLFGREPGHGNADPRLQTSASSMWTALMDPATGSPGLTCLDRLEQADFGPGGGYNRTSEALFERLRSLALPNWGLPEYAPSWHIDVAPDPDPDRIKAQFHRAYASGVHMFGLTPWPHFDLTQNGPALGQFLSEVRRGPRIDAPYTTDELFVEQLYLDLLGRVPTDAELLAATAGIEDGSTPRARLVVDLTASLGRPQALAFMARLTLALAGRNPTQAEVAAAETTLAQFPACTTDTCLGPKLQSLAAAVLGSPAFIARFGQNGNSMNLVSLVNVLFQNLLGRTVDNATAIAFANLGSAARITMEIGNADEARNRWSGLASIVVQHAALLDDQPSPAQFSQWASHLDLAVPPAVGAPATPPGPLMGVAQVLQTSADYIFHVYF